MVGPAAATHLAFAQQPTNAESAATFPVVVHLLDAQGNVASLSSATVTLTPSSGHLMDAEGATVNTLSAASVNGVATFSVRVKEAGTGYTLTASSTPVLTTAVSDSFTISFVATHALHCVFACASHLHFCVWSVCSSFQKQCLLFHIAGSATAASLAFVDQPVNSVSGAQFTVRVSVVDAQGNLCEGAESNITIQLASATLSGNLLVTAVRGVAAFNLSVAEEGTGYHLVASSALLSSATSTAFSIGEYHAVIIKRNVLFRFYTSIQVY
jgi:hypothetical protein